MKLRVTADRQFLQVVDSTQLELEQLEYSFTKKVDNYFIIKKKVPHWDGEVKFIDRYNRIPIGLWQEIKKIADKFNYHLEIENANDIFTNKEYDPEDLEKWIEEYFVNEKFQPRSYQIDGVKAVLKYRFCTEEISTSGGKTLIAFMIFKYLLDKGLIKKMLYVVPNINLVTQTEEKFYEYEDRCDKRPNWRSECIFSGAKVSEEVKDGEKNKVNITFGTFQSLSKRNVDYFKNFDAVCIDECLHPDTLITMYDFTQKKIKDLCIGERVWTKNEISGENEIKEIEYIYKNLSKNQQMYEIETEEGIIKITGNHKVLTKESIWKRVDELSENDDIVCFDMMDI